MNNPPANALRESHSLSFHPTVWKWLTELANGEYENNISAAVTALVIYDRGIRNAKLAGGKEHAHHLTKGVPQDPVKLEAVLREIEGVDPGFCARTWLEITREEAAAPAQAALDLRSEEEFWRLRDENRRLKEQLQTAHQELARMRSAQQI